MFNRKVQKEIEELRKENERLKKENENLNLKITKMNDAIENYKLNYLNKKLEVRAWQYAVQDFVLDKTNDNRFTTFVFNDVGDLAGEHLEYLKKQNEYNNYDDGTISFIKY